MDNKITLTTRTVENVSEIGVISSVGAVGYGLFTSFAYSICCIFGIKSDSWANKIEKAKDHAVERFRAKAEAIKADGVMDVQFHISALSVLVSGTAYKINAPQPAETQNPEV